MKTIIKTVLLLAVLCLAGCKEDQSVSFTVHEAEVDFEGTRLTIGIQANCPWTITDEANKTITDQKTGTGSITTQVAVFSSSSYDDQTYRITVTSEDGSSSDVLTIRQKAKPAILADNTGLISEEGGTFTIPVKTNDNITSVDTPDWITFTSSRTLTGYTYTFTAEPNKTGAVRKGTVSFKGSDTNGAVEVTQDSFIPTGIDVSSIPDMVPVLFSYETMSVEPVSYKLPIEPEYADPSKISVNSQFPTACDASIVGDSIRLTFKSGSWGYGQYINFTFFSGGKEIAEKKVEPVRGDIGIIKGRREFYLGEEFEIQVMLPEKYYTTKVSDTKAIKMLSPNNFRAERTGTYTISFTNSASGISVDIPVTISKCIANAYMSYCYDWGSMWDVQITGEFMANNITEYTTAFIDGNRNLQVPLNKDSGTSSGTNYLVNNYSFSIIAYDREDLEYKIKNFKFAVSGKVDGEDYSCTIPVSPKKP